MLEDLLNMAVVHDRDAVGDIHDFVEFEGDQKDCYAPVALLDQHSVHVFDRADVQSSRGLDRDQKLGILSDLAADDDLLLVAAGEAARQLGAAVLGANVIGSDQFFRKAPHPLSVDRAVRGILGRSVFFQNRVLVHGESEDQAVFVSVRGDRRHSAVDAVLGILVLDLQPVEDDLALAFLEVVDRFHQFLLAVSVDSRNTYDLAGVDLKVEVLHGVEVLVVLDIKVLDVQDHFAWLRWILADDKLDCSANHHLSELILRDVLDRNCVDILSAADDRAHV